MTTRVHRKEANGGCHNPCIAVNIIARPKKNESSLVVTELPNMGWLHGHSCQQFRRELMTRSGRGRRGESAPRIPTCACALFGSALHRHAAQGEASAAPLGGCGQEAGVLKVLELLGGGARLGVGRLGPSFGYQLGRRFGLGLQVRPKVVAQAQEACRGAQAGWRRGTAAQGKDADCPCAGQPGSRRRPP